MVPHAQLGVSCHVSHVMPGVYTYINDCVPDEANYEELLGYLDYGFLFAYAIGMFFRSELLCCSSLKNLWLRIVLAILSLLQLYYNYFCLYYMQC